MAQQDYLSGKKVVVFGFGRQGRALATWLPTVGAETIVTDSRTALELKLRRKNYPGVKFHLGGHPEEAVLGAHYICVSGGVPLDLPALELARTRNITFTNDAQLFMERCPAPIIGITGSAGKTTTTKLVGNILEKGGYKVWVGGNIGNPLIGDLDTISKDDIVVMELSSFQLDLMTVSPQVAAIINITPNHLDRHGTMENYINAKANIIKYQTPSDVAVLGTDDKIVSQLEPLVAGELSSFSRYDMVPDGAFMMGSRILVAGSASYDMMPHVVVERSDIPLRGDHNVMNVLAACAITGAMGLATNRPGIMAEDMAEAIKEFEPVEHRLEIVREKDGITYVNDSIATAPERLAAALQSYDEPLVLLIGGADKDLPWEAVLVMAMQKSKHIIVFGEAGEKQVSTKVMDIFDKLRIFDDQLSQVENLEQAVERAHEVAEDGDVVLLSPGGTSYDAYTDFAERGEHFRELVTKL